MTDFDEDYLQDMRKDTADAPEPLFRRTDLRASNDRPGGIPHHWIAKPTRKGSGTRFINPENPHDQVRVMPGEPNSPHPAQQTPYVKRMKDGSAYDAAGRKVDSRSAEAHIPLRDFRFKE
jgi:hypothetical protein